MASMHWSFNNSSIKFIVVVDNDQFFFIVVKSARSKDRCVAPDRFYDNVLLHWGLLHWGLVHGGITPAM